MALDPSACSINRLHADNGCALPSRECDSDARSLDKCRWKRTSRHVRALPSWRLSGVAVREWLVHGLQRDRGSTDGPERVHTDGQTRRSNARRSDIGTVRRLSDLPVVQSWQRLVDRWIDLATER